MKTLTILLLMISATTVFAQDIITKTNGDEIKANVIEVESEKVKYKKWENQDGPIYSIPKSEVFMIKYKNGDRDVFANDLEKKKENIQSVNHQYDSLMRLAKSNRAWGIVGCVAGAVFIPTGVAMIIYAPSTTIPTGMYVAGGVVLAGGIAEIIIGPIALMQGSKQRNAAEKIKPVISMRIPQVNYDPQAKAASVKLQLQF